MKQTFLERVRESLAAAMADYNQSVIPLYGLSRTPKTKGIQNTNVTSHNKRINTLIVGKKGVHS
ncbi:MAG: hypothetical protein Q7U51_11340 [Methanoregula sp.]|nr:hypothetical protein [Methanoregula sp.]